MGNKLLADINKSLSKRVVAFHRELAEIGGGPLEGLFLSQALYWMNVQAKSGKTSFYKSAREWEDEVCIRRDQLKTIRKNLRNRGLISEELRGIPATVHYSLNLPAIEVALSAIQFTDSAKGVADPANLITDSAQPDEQIPQAIHRVRKEDTEKTTDILGENPLGQSSLEEIPLSDALRACTQTKDFW